MTRTPSRPLSVPRASALYIGALLGPGLLLLPGLAVDTAGPAAILSLAGLLVLSGLLAAVFTGLGIRMPSSGGARTYVATAFGERAGEVASWAFLAGVITGAPIVCLIGGAYVADLFGGSADLTAVIALVLLALVVAVTLAGLRSSSGMQLGLVIVIIAVTAVAVLGTLAAGSAANWAPFAPHGIPAIGQAAALLMLSFVGWEAAAPLTARLDNPRRRLPRVTAIAFLVTAAIFLGLFFATIGVLGPHPGAVPLNRLLQIAIGPVGQIIGVVIAVVLTLSTTNSYLAGATEMLRDRVTRVAGAGASRGLSPRLLLLLIGAVGAVMLILMRMGVVTTDQLITIPTALFLTVYVGCTAAATRLLGGTMRVVSVIALLSTLVILVFCGWSLLAPALITAVVLSAGRRIAPRGLKNAAEAPSSAA